MICLILGVFLGIAAKKRSSYLKSGLILFCHSIDVLSTTGHGSPCTSVKSHSITKNTKENGAAAGDYKGNGANDNDDDGGGGVDEEEEFNDLLAELGICGLVEDTETIKAMWLDLGCVQHSPPHSNMRFSVVISCKC